MTVFWCLQSFWYSRLSLLSFFKSVPVIFFAEGEIRSNRKPIFTILKQNTDPRIPIKKAVYIYIYITLPETNVAPENRPSQKETSIPTIHF